MSIHARHYRSRLGPTASLPERSSLVQAWETPRPKHATLYFVTKSPSNSLGRLDRIPAPTLLSLKLSVRCLNGATRIAPLSNRRIDLTYSRIGSLFSLCRDYLGVTLNNKSTLELINVPLRHVRL